MMKNEKKNKIIWVDLDEVLSETIDYLLEYNNYMIWSYSIKREDVKDYYIHRMDHLDITEELAVDWFRKPMLNDIDKKQIIPIKWSKNKLLELKDKWHSLVIITARTEDVFWEYTKKWINHHFEWIFDDIIFANHFHKESKEKHQICMEMWINIMIEDNYDYAMWLSKSWVKTYLLEKPWNNWQNDYHDNIIKIMSWDDLNI